jgi:uncharacterized membrane protein
VKQLFKYLFLWVVGGNIYYLMEIIYRGYSHWTMFIVGGICFILLGLINEILSWNTPLWLQGTIGATIITGLEFISGCIINLVLKLNVWDYSNMPFNILGQVCLPFYFIWIFVSLFGIILDDYIRYILFKEKKPKYRIL